ncbi:GNAT family N-acetyltransferase [Kitasatospora sp. NBC_00315]|uniref:GNAT family N-acetyltransferase n=1 Tax=Kitasatospora sp. NBC_00315 TaxID=2975963 RepID=UPI00324D07ED
MEHPADVVDLDPVRLRRWRADDAATLDRIVAESLAHLRPWSLWAVDHDLDAAVAFLADCEDRWRAGTAYHYAITTGGAVVGGCGLMRRIGPGGLEIGYWLHAGRTGRGFATAAAAALVREGFRLDGTDRMEIHHDVANEASAAVPRRLGFAEVERRSVPPGSSAPAELGTDVIWRILPG